MSIPFREIIVGRNKFCIDPRYTELKPAGNGAYGLVASALDTVTGLLTRPFIKQMISAYAYSLYIGNRVAIKKVKDTFADLIDAKRILREIKLLRHFVSHENIISILDIMTYPPNTVDFTDIYIVNAIFVQQI